MKTVFAIGLLAITQTAFAVNNNNIDANATRQAVGMDAISIVSLLVLVIFLLVLGFATQKIPGLKS